MACLAPTVRLVVAVFAVLSWLLLGPTELHAQLLKEQDRVVKKALLQVDASRQALRQSELNLMTAYQKQAAAVLATYLDTTRWRATDARALFYSRKDSARQQVAYVLMPATFFTQTFISPAVRDSLNPYRAAPSLIPPTAGLHYWLASPSFDRTGAAVQTIALPDSLRAFRLRQVAAATKLAAHRKSPVLVYERLAPSYAMFFTPWDPDSPSTYYMPDTTDSSALFAPLGPYFRREKQLRSIKELAADLDTTLLPAVAAEELPSSVYNTKQFKKYALLLLGKQIQVMGTVVGSYMSAKGNLVLKLDGNRDLPSCTAIVLGAQDSFLQQNAAVLEKKRVVVTGQVHSFGTDHVLMSQGAAAISIQR